MAIVAKFTRTLPAPSATISSGFVFLLSEAWFTQADLGAAGSPIDGGINSLANGGGDMQIFSDTAATTRLPIEVVTFVTGVTPDAQVWVRTPSYTSGDTITIGKDDTQVSQPAVGAAFGRNATWTDFEAVLHLNEVGVGSAGDYTDSTGNGYSGSGGDGVAFETPTQTSTGHPFGGQWQDFDGTNDYISIASTGSILDATDFTISAWGISDKAHDTTDVAFLSNRHTGVATDKFLMSVDNGGVAAHVGDTYTKGSSGLQNTLMRRSLINDQSNWWSRINGAANVTSVSGAVSTTDTVWVGRYFDNNASRRWEGKIGEVWIRLFTISFEHDESEYDNQNDPDNFGTSSEWILVAGGITITADSGTYSYTGTDNSLLVSRILSADSGSYTYAGTSVNLLTGAILTANTGAYAYSGTDANLIYTPAGSFTLIADSGEYTYSGTDINFNRNRVIIASSGAYTYSGTDISIILPGQIWTDKPSVSTSWNNQTNVTTIWTDK